MTRWFLVGLAVGVVLYLLWRKYGSGPAAAPGLPVAPKEVFALDKLNYQTPAGLYKQSGIYL